MKCRILFLLILLPFLVFSQNKSIPIYKNPSEPVESRIKDLLKRMTLREKTAQMQDISFSELCTSDTVDLVKMEKRLKGMSYGCIEGMDLTAEQYAQAI